MEPRSLRNWAPAIVAAVVFAGVVGATLVTGGDGDAAGGTGPSTTAPLEGSVDTTVAPGPSTLPGYTTTTLAFEPLTQTLGPNSAGSAVESLQQRLKELAFDHHHKLYRTGELYDLQADPKEKSPLTGELPARAKLQAVLDQFKDARPAELDRQFEQSAPEKPKKGKKKK